MEKEKVLIIKTGNTEILYKEQYSRIISLGDVLRTTPLLHRYKDYEVIWATDQTAFPLLEGNPYITRLVDINNWAERRVLQESRFEKIINLEKTPGICLFADEDLKAWQRFGFRYDPSTGQAKSHDKSTEALIISFDDAQKKNNQKSFQQFLFEMVGEKFNGEDYILGYKPQTEEVYDLGFNTQVGNKWPSKSWPMEKWEELEKIINGNFSISRQDKQGTEVLTNLHRYIDWINSCRALITNDSLGIHIALALKKNVLCLFGPTSSSELYLYDKGRVIFPKDRPSCAPCFEPGCLKYKGSSCMDLISVEEVHHEIQKLFKDNCFMNMNLS